MGRLTKAQLAYVLARRNQHVSSNMLHTELESQVGDISQEEHNSISAWNACIDTISMAGWKGVREATIANVMSLKTGHTCPIPTSMFVDPKQILGYYACAGYSTSPQPKTLTSEQNAVAEYGKLLSSKEPSHIIVNAGPGTGKTTTAVEYIRNVVAVKERVLVLAYTNSAVTTLRRRLRGDIELAGLYKADPFDIKAKTAGIPILICTLDHVANAILRGSANMSLYGGAIDFEKNIGDATAKLLSGKSAAVQCFFKNGQVPSFTHVLVDEAQMLNDNRATMIETLVATMQTDGINGKRSCHLAMFCDPKQTISHGTGQWLTRIFTSPAKYPNVKIIQLTKTFRYTTQEMLSFVMSISNKRPELHVDLTPGNRTADSVGRPAVEMFPISDIDTVCTKIGSDYTSSASVALLAPTIGRSNIVSHNVNAIVMGLRKINIPVCIHTDDNFQGNGVKVITFQSSAGMEFEHVYLVGADGFPNNCPQISMTTARSLIFVANSRAKTSIGYIVQKSEVPVDVEQNLIKSHTDETVKEYAIPDAYTLRMPAYWTSELLFTADSVKFYGINDEAWSKYVKLDVNLNCSVDPYGIYEAFGKNPCLIEAAKASGTEGKCSPSAAHAKGYASRGRIGYTVNGKPTFAGILDHPDPEANDVDRFYWYRNERKIKEQKTGPRFLSLLRDMLEEHFPESTELKCCRSIVLGQYNLSHDMYFTSQDRLVFITFTNDPYVAMLPASVYWDYKKTKPVAVAVSYSGNVKVLDGFHSAYVYYTNALVKIQEYMIKSSFKDKFYESVTSFNTSEFAIDTEFVRGRDIYDISLVNINDPYKTIMSVIKCHDVDDSRLLKMRLDRKDYNTIAIDMDDFKMRILNACGHSTIKIMYFAAKQDVTWVDGDIDAELVDVTSITNGIIPKMGTFNSDSSIAASLNALYGTFVEPVPVEGRHTALPDTLMLIEILREIVRKGLV